MESNKVLQLQISEIVDAITNGNTHPITAKKDLYESFLASITPSSLLERVQDAAALRWVKASERLPESDGKYICKKSPVSNNDIYVSEAFFNSGKFQSAHYITEWLEEYRQAQPVPDSGNMIEGEGVKKWEVKFGARLKCRLKLENGVLTVEDAVDGWGDNYNDAEITKL